MQGQAVCSRIPVLGRQDAAPARGVVKDSEYIAELQLAALSRSVVVHIASAFSQASGMMNRRRMSLLISDDS